MTDGFQIFKISGIPIRIHSSWFIVFFLVAWTLAGGYFPSRIPGVPTAHLWGLSVATALLFFSSILLHELAHSYVARRYGIVIRGITLFIFGGVAQMAGESRSPKAEMRIAAAGPLLSFGLSGLFYGVAVLQGEGGGSASVEAVSRFLTYTNGLLALFNLIPGFPLDGGRILCAILWNYSGNLRKATRITSRIGKGFAISLMLLGGLEVLQGYLLNGLWLVFIGFFLQQAAEAGYRNLLLRESLAALRVADIMKAPVITVSPDMSLEEVVNQYFFRYRFNAFPVTSGAGMVGMISLNDVKAVSRDRWSGVNVAGAMDRDLDANTISAEAGVLNALEKMVEKEKGRLAVTSGRDLVGILSQRDIMQATKVRVDLGGEPGGGVKK